MSQKVILEYLFDRPAQRLSIQFLSQRAVRGMSGLTSEMTLLGYIEILLEDR